MADRKITGHTAITAAQVDPANDVFEIVDVSDTNDAASGTNKKMTSAEVKKLVNIQQYAIGTSKNRYIPAALTAQSLTTGAVSINTIRATPFVVNYPMTIDRIVCEVTTGATGNVRLGIWSDDGTGYPASLILDSGAYAITTPAVYGTSNVVSATLNPGLYWFGFLADTANTFRLGSPANYSPTVGLPAAFAGTFIHVNWSVSYTYGSLPDPFPAGGTATVLNQPIIAIRIT